MYRQENSLVPGATSLLLKGAENAESRQSQGRDLAILAKRCWIFVAGPLLLLGFLPFSRSEEKQKILAREPRSVVLSRYRTSNVTFSPDGRNLIWNCGEFLHTYVVDANTERQTLVWKGEWFAGLSPDGTLIALDGFEEDKEGIAALRNAKGITEADKEKIIEALGMRGKGDRFVAIRKLKTGDLVLKLKRFAMGFFAFSPDGKTAITSGLGGVLGFWELPSGKLRRTIELQSGHSVQTVQFSPDGKSLATGGLARQQEFGKQERLQDLPSFLALWDLASGKMLTEFKGMNGYISSVAFSPDGKLLAAGGSIGEQINEIVVWDVATKEKRSTLTGHRGGVAALAFSHDGKLLASAGGGRNDGELRLWDVKKMQEIRSLKGHSAQLTSVAFSPDDSKLATGSMDGTVRLWYLHQPAENKRDR
jgi:WD40 repeat protein